ncbi:MAG: cysteine desulfurase [Planctomycetes bacterium]|nr:cysteine desulfurase [Planctomycetota bacterium]
MTAERAIYLDNAATTRPLPEVVDAMATTALDCFGNPSSKHSFGPPARQRLEDAREFLRGTLGAAEIVFTSGGSEADYLGIVGAAAMRSSGRVLMAQSDHPAILECSSLLARWRHQVTRLPVTRTGGLDPETLFGALGRDVAVVALLHGHNELGTLLDLPALVELIRRAAPDAHIHVDLVQTYGKLPFDLDDADVDSVAVSGHKFHGPRGVGFLALSSKARIAPLQLAGGQEHGLRGGTENVPGAVGLMVAAEHAMTTLASTAQHTRTLADMVESAVLDEFPDAVRLGDPERRLPHIVSLRIPGVIGETLMLRCDRRGLAFSIGAACHGAHDDSKPQKVDNHVLAAIGLDRQAAREVFRISFARTTTTAEVRSAIDILVDEASALRDQAPRGNAADGARR